LALKCSKRDPLNPRPKIAPCPIEPRCNEDPPESLSELHLDDPTRYADSTREKLMHEKHLEAKKNEGRKKLLKKIAKVGGLAAMTAASVISFFVAGSFYVR
jgi:hypothetical protein